MRASFFAASEEALFLLDTRGRLRYVTPAFAQLFGHPAEAYRGLSCRSRRKPTLEDPWEDHLTALLQAPAEVLQGQPLTVRRLLRRPAPPTTYDIAFLPLRRSPGMQVIGRLRAVEIKPDRGRPLPEGLVSLRQQQVSRWSLELLGDPAGRLAVQARLAAELSCPVLLVGPPGSGKATVARVIHYHSAQRERPLAVLRASSLSKVRLRELLEESPGSACPAALLLRRLDQAPAECLDQLVDWLEPYWSGLPLESASVRLYASVCDPTRLPATLAPLRSFEITVPALNERLGEWEQLQQRLLERLKLLPGTPLQAISPAAQEILQSYRWPGNLRELYQLLLEAREGCRSGVLERQDLPAWLRISERPPVSPPSLDLQATLQQVERRLIVLALHRARGNRSRAAEILGLTRGRLLRRIEQLGIREGEAER